MTPPRPETTLAKALPPLLPIIFHFFFFNKFLRVSIRVTYVSEYYVAGRRLYCNYTVTREYYNNTVMTGEKQKNNSFFLPKQRTRLARPQDERAESGTWYNGRKNIGIAFTTCIRVQ